MKRDDESCPWGQLLQLSENAEDYRKPKKGLAKQSSAAQRKRCRAASAFPTLSESSQKLLETTTALRTGRNAPLRRRFRWCGRGEALSERGPRRDMRVRPRQRAHLGRDGAQQHRRGARELDNRFAPVGREASQHD